MDGQMDATKCIISLLRQSFAVNNEITQDKLSLLGFMGPIGTHLTSQLAIKGNKPDAT